MPIRADDLSVDWFSSSYSNDQGGACVQGARVTAAMAVRDSKLPHGPVFVVPAPAWAAFISAVSEGEFS
ncbi:DUF397 domain-containing protein [Streptomyces sp. V2]|uniref:DUF397 domain-containing protein n=1 Tax=Streptomyces TaxID=1883 RepID=UPI0006EBCD42|nr:MULTISPECIES: DUF397 domain-containing protein [Streptomyces]PWG15265.1 DUF397 domain-containing protein [Streptomyces sp. V2]QZZ25593.1 DUF397 domain-containing protein [Streptomyces sp. ST1015]